MKTHPIVCSAAAALLLSAPALAQAAAPTRGSGVSIWALFQQSFDLFTIAIVVGSVAALAIIIRSVLVVRLSVVLPEESGEAIRRLIGERRWADLQKFVSEDDSYLGHVLHQVLPRLRHSGARTQEIVDIASEKETARRFREIEWLGVLGAIGPLLGLVGTVWGMIIAFTAIGETGGQAAAAQLSIGIAKALFHTFLGLTLAIPSLIAYGVFRERMDRLCVEGAMQATDAVNAILAAGAAPAQPAAPATAMRTGQPAA
ncbi:MAG: MotA/TolQ/ExbB proton channel family protein [Phycisphaerales bacterium]|nr:MotA/TolQ/ExbB proton channel family protein [Phycisphaerales bacterium]